MLKFNMGCGQNQFAGYVNVDAYEACKPDEVVDLERTPWPWPDNCASEVVFNHSLEHMGATSQAFLAIVQELYRICAPDAEVQINVPHPRSDDFLNDPTHVRAISPDMLSLFDRSKNEGWVERGAANTPLALYLGVDFRLTNAETRLAEPHASEFREGRCSTEELVRRLRELNNVAIEYRIRLKVHKPG